MTSAGDQGYTLAEFAAEAARQAGGRVEYRNMSETDYDAALRAAGFPAGTATMLSTSHTAIGKGDLFRLSTTPGSDLHISAAPARQVVRDHVRGHVAPA